MKDASRFSLKITAYSPATIPMARLAEYMRELAALMGSEAHVHYSGATKGCTVMHAKVESEDVPKVADRLRSAAGEDAAAEVRKVLDRINSLLRGDNARGALSHNGERLIKFVGIDAPSVKRIGPVFEATTFEGELVRVGGKDKTLHALIVGSDGEEAKVTTRSRDQAKQLAANLFANVRVSGIGLWFRTEAGTWELDELRMESFEPVSERSLIEAVAELRAVQGNGWRGIADPLATVRSLRKH